MCVDCVLASLRIAHVDLGDEPLPEVVLSHVLNLIFSPGTQTCYSEGEDGLEFFNV
jgi:hypothetical protein